MVTIVTVHVSQVSNLNCPSFFSFHTRHSGHIAVSDVSTSNKWMMSNKGQPGEPSDYPPLPFLTMEAGPHCWWQCGKQEPLFNCPQPLPNNNDNVAIPLHTTPNHAANNKDEQPTTTTTNDCPLTKTNQHQPKPTTSIHMNRECHRLPWGFPE